MITTSGIYVCDECNKTISGDEECINFMGFQLCTDCYEKVIRVTKSQSFVNRLKSLKRFAGIKPTWKMIVPSCKECGVELAASEIENTLICPKCRKQYELKDFMQNIKG